MTWAVTAASEDFHWWDAGVRSQGQLDPGSLMCGIDGLASQLNAGVPSRIEESSIWGLLLASSHSNLGASNSSKNLVVPLSLIFLTKRGRVGETSPSSSSMGVLKNPGNKWASWCAEEFKLKGLDFSSSGKAYPICSMEADQPRTSAAQIQENHKNSSSQSDSSPTRACECGTCSWLHVKKFPSHEATLKNCVHVSPDEITYWFLLFIGKITHSFLLPERRKSYIVLAAARALSSLQCLDGQCLISETQELNCDQKKNP